MVQLISTSITWSNFIFCFHLQLQLQFLFVQLDIYVRPFEVVTGGDLLFYGVDGVVEGLEIYFCSRMSKDGINGLFNGE